MQLKQIDLEFFQQITTNYTQEFLQKYFSQEKFDFVGHQVIIGDKNRFCTMEGILDQVASFSANVGLIYYMDEIERSLSKRPVVLDN
jgi:hypothetical protein